MLITTRQRWILFLAVVVPFVMFAVTAVIIVLFGNTLGASPLMQEFATAGIGLSIVGAVIELFRRQFAETHGVDIEVSLPNGVRPNAVKSADVDIVMGSATGGKSRKLPGLPVSAGGGRSVHIHVPYSPSNNEVIHVYIMLLDNTMLWAPGISLGRFYGQAVPKDANE